MSSKNGAKKLLKTEARELPELIITKDATKGCNNAFYVVKIPREFIPTGMLMAKFYEYQFIGLKKGYPK